jgi:hypothetical protein
MRAVGEETLEPRFGFRRGVRTGDAGDVEAARTRLRDERCLDLIGVGQKSRLA